MPTLNARHCYILKWEGCIKLLYRYILKSTLFCCTDSLTVFTKHWPKHLQGYHLQNSRTFKEIEDIVQPRIKLSFQWQQFFSCFRQILDFSRTLYIHLYSPERQQQQVKEASNTQQLYSNVFVPPGRPGTWISCRIGHEYIFNSYRMLFLFLYQ